MDWKIVCTVIASIIFVIPSLLFPHFPESHDTLNRLRRTVVVIPLSTAAKTHPPITIPVSCQGKAAVAVIDQIRAVAKHLLRERIETMPKTQFEQICRSLSTILEIK